jgi:predicted ATPase
MHNFFVITGGPGSGKSTLIHALQQRGYRCFEEAARQIIKEQMSVDGDAVPWKNLSRFKKLIFLRTLENHRQALKTANEVTFFDRDVLDLVAYDRLTHNESFPELLKAVEDVQYSRKVFLAPPWKEIYRNDTERKQTFEESLEIYANIVRVYTEYGRELIELPKVSVEERVKFIIDHLT